MTYAPKIQGDFALNQIVVHLALVTRSIAGPGNQAIVQSTLTMRKRPPVMSKVNREKAPYALPKNCKQIEIYVDLNEFLYGNNE